MKKQLREEDDDKSRAGLSHYGSWGSNKLWAPVYLLGITIGLSYAKFYFAKVDQDLLPYINTLLIYKLNPTEFRAKGGLSEGPHTVLYIGSQTASLHSLQLFCVSSSPFSMAALSYFSSVCISWYRFCT